MYKYIFLFIFSCSLFADPDYQVVEDKNTLIVLTPGLAKRETLKIRLKNGLEAYLISDPGLDKSGAGLAVNMGSWSNPDEYPGLAHFLEHMLFLGTKKYPEEGGYQRFIDENAGMHNAFTAADKTVYMFSVSNEAFPQALDQFAQFFVYPLFLPSGVSREAHAIDQEYAKNLQNDNWRAFHVSKTLENPKHPESRFDIGNLETVSKIPIDVLRKWFNAHYSANLMHLVAYSSIPMNELVKLVSTDFNEIPSHEVTPFYPSQSISSPENVGIYVYIEPYQDKRELEIEWELPSKYQYDADVIAAALGYENEKSLTQLLKNEHLAEEVNVGTRLYTPSMQFILNISLTDEGVKNVDKVILHCFETIHLLQKEGIPKSFFDEVKELSTLTYEYQSRQDVFGMVMNDAEKMIDEPLDTFPYKTSVPSKYSPEDIKTTLDYLTPERAQYLVIAREELTGVKPTQTEPWFNVEYSVKKVPEKTLLEWSQAPLNPLIQPPEPNPFVPKNLSLLNSVEKNDNLILPTPRAIVDTTSAIVFYKEDTRLLVPETASLFRIYTPGKSSGNPVHEVLADLYVRVLRNSLNALNYQGREAHLSFALNPMDAGFKLSLQGYSEKAPLFFEEMLAQMITSSPTEQEFSDQKNSLQKDYENAALDTPLKQAQEILKAILYKNYVTTEKKAKAIQKVTYQDFLTFKKTLFQKTYIEAIIYGNLHEQEAINLYKTLQKSLGSTPLPKSAITKKSVLKLNAEKGPFLFSREIKQFGNACILVIEDGCFTLKKRAALQILAKGMQEPFFSELRTRQQTGYIVSSAEQEMERELFLFFLVQSNTYDPCDLNARFELFLDNFLREFKTDEITKERFETIQKSLITEISTSPKNISQMLNSLDALAFEYDEQFDWMEKRVQAMKELTYEEFSDFAKEFLGRSNHRRLSIQMEGVLPKENQLHYSHIPTLQKMRKMGEYYTAEQNLCPQDIKQK